MLTVWIEIFEVCTGFCGVSAKLIFKTTWYIPMFNNMGLQSPSKFFLRATK